MSNKKIKSDKHDFSNVSSAGEQSLDSGWTQIASSRSRTSIPQHHHTHAVSHSYATRSSKFQHTNVTGTDCSTFNLFINVIHPILMQADAPSSLTWLHTWRSKILQTSSWNIVRCSLHINTLHELYDLLITCPDI
jgi:hypothetical protein